jgi:GT2 family glycosyltransferase
MRTGPLASIVIPIYNGLAFARECVDSIYRAAAGRAIGALPFEVIAVDNGSGPEMGEWMAQARESRPEFHCLRYCEPLGYARAANLGAARARGRTVVVLNSDTIVTPGWLEALHEILHADPTLGVLSPMTNMAGEAAVLDLAASQLPAAKAVDFAAGRAVCPEVLILPQRLTFFCAAFRTEVWRDLNGFTESFATGNFEDDDFCLRARLAGYRLGVARHVFVYHLGNATFHVNHIDHARTIRDNSVLFAERAAAAALGANPAPRRWPRSELRDVSVVVQPLSDMPLADTLRSLVNQTVTGFEVVLPRGEEPVEAHWRAALRFSRQVTGAFTSYVRQGDILYPFHLEALHDVLRRQQAQAVHSSWALRAGTLYAERRSANPPLGAWMHRSELDPERLFDVTRPVHWPRMTWESRSASEADSVPASGFVEPKSALDRMRGLYRRVVPYQTRLAIERVARRSLRLVPPAGGQAAPAVTARANIDRALSERRDHGRFAISGEVPEIFLFSIVPWASLVQRPHHFARGLAARGHPVFWVNPALSLRSTWWTGQPFEEVAPGVRLIELPGPVPDVHSWTGETVDAECVDTMTAALRQTAFAYGCRRPVCLVNDPRWEPVVSRLNWTSVYDCLDNQAAFAELWRTQLGDREERLFNQADLLLFSGRLLLEQHGRRGSVLLPNAADYGLFSSAPSHGYLAHLAKPVCGFFGAFSGWLDLGLIEAAARHFPNWSFVYIGCEGFPDTESRDRWRRAAQHRNMTVLPPMDPIILAAHLTEFDVCTVPFLDLPISRTMNTVKIYEYLAAGKPVVSRDLPEMGPLAEQGLISVYRTRTEFFERLEQAVLDSGTPAEIERRRAFAAANTWDHRVDDLQARLRRLVNP